jgi:predicted metal-dependent hydrolase
VPKISAMPDLSIFGTVSFIKSQRASRITVRIQRDSLRVTLPPRGTQAEATLWLLENHNLILRKQEKIKKRQHKLLITDERTLETYTFSVKVQKAERDNVHFRLKDDLLTIEYPADADIRTDKLQETCWNGIRYFLKKDAQRILPERLAELAAKYQFQYKNLKIQSGKTRWGSCSGKQNINLSVYLMLLPQHLIDYVILHELCHTREMNHGDKFWKLMDEVTSGKTIQLRREMKKYHIPVH